MAKNPSENMIQTTLIAWFGRTWPELKGRMFSIPNGAHLSGDCRQRAQQMNRLKAEGLSVGVPDLFLPVVTSDYAGLFLELKKEGGRASKEQKAWSEYLTAAGYKAVIVFGLDSAKSAILEYLR